MMKRSENSVVILNRRDDIFEAVTAVCLGLAAWSIACYMEHGSPIFVGWMAALISTLMHTFASRRNRSFGRQAVLSVAGVIAFLMWLFFFP